MLGKLFKHEMQENGKLLLPMNLILIAATIVGALLIKTGLFTNKNLMAIPVIYMILYIFSMIAFFLLTAVYIIMRFYKTMYSGQGYLTHTLPASSAAILNAKLFSALIWLILCFIICVCSVFTLLFSAEGFPSANDLSVLQQAISDIFALPFPATLGMIILAIIIFYLASILMVYACLSVGQLFGQYRIPAAIVAYIVFYIIQQVISLISLVAFGIGLVNNVDTSSQMAIIKEASEFYRNLMLIIIGESALFGAAYYITCLYITKKKLNLE